MEIEVQARTCQVTLRHLFNIVACSLPRMDSQRVLQMNGLTKLACENGLLGVSW